MLSKEELKSLSYYFLGARNIEKGKSLKLLDYLKTDKVISQKELEKEIYGKNNYTAFNKLINRLENKLLDTLILSNNLSNQTIYSERNIIFFEFRKMLIIADILQLRGERIICNRIYKNVINKSKSLEFYDILLQALYSFNRLNNVIKESKKTQVEIRKAEECLYLLNKSKDIFNVMVNKINLDINSINFINELGNSVEIIFNNYQSTQSPTIGYYYLTLKTELYQKRKEYLESLSSLKMLKSIVEQNKSVYTKNRFGTVLLNIGNAQLLLRNYQQAETNVIESKKYFIGLNLTLLIADEVLFLVYFHSENNKSFDLISSMISTSSSLNSKLYNKFLYYRACLSFKSKNYKNSLKDLLIIEKGEFQSSSFHINLQILKILCMIEADNTEKIESHITVIEKYVKRKANLSNIENRSIKILKLIKYISLLSFEKKRIRTNKKILNIYYDLKKENGDLAWNTKSPELIRFDKWLEEKYFFNNQVL